MADRPDHRACGAGDAVRQLAELRAADQRLAHYAEAAQLRGDGLDRELSALRGTKLYRYSDGARRIYGLLRRLLGRREPLGNQAPTRHSHGFGDYERWMSIYQAMDDARRARLAERLSEARVPTISVLMPVFDPPVEFLRRAIESVRLQVFQNWELCVVDDASADPEVVRLIRESAEADRRIKVARREINGGISAASNDALAMATGSWITFLDHDDELPQHALAIASLSIVDHPDAKLLYSDEDKIDEDGRLYAPFFKPDFDPLLILGQNYLCHMTLVDADVIRSVGGFKEGVEGSQDWDLFLRVLECIDVEHVVHVPHVLYHWRTHRGSTALDQAAKPYAAVAGTRAVQEHLARCRVVCDVVRDPATGWHRIKWQLPKELPLVSIVIPTKDGRYLDRCLSSLFGFTTYPRYEVIVVDNGSQEVGTLEKLEAYVERLQVLRDERPFNFAALNNEAVAIAGGSVLCLLNDDCEVSQGEWLEEMVRQLSRPGVGAVGAKLVYPDSRLQHGGVVLGIRGAGGHPYRHSEPTSAGNYGSLQLVRTMSAVTGASMVVRREAWEEVGGLDEEHLATSFNDIDFCLRLSERGWRTVWTPFAELVHHESVSRGLDENGDGVGSWTELEYMKERWGSVLLADPAYNPNLTLEDESGGLAWPPRVMF